MEFIRLPREQNILTKPLYEEVFCEDKGAFSDYYYDQAAPKSTIYVARDNDGIHSMIHLNPYTLDWNGELIGIPYIVAVATEEKLRHRGLMRTLLEQIFRDLKEEHVPFAFLMPINEAIYKPFGFERSWSWRWEEDVLGVKVPRGKEEVSGANVPQGKEGASGAKTLQEGKGICESGALQEMLNAEDCPDKLLEQLADHVNRELSGRFELFTHRTVDYYRKLALEQKASGGRLLICMKDGLPQAAVQTAREYYPPMMCRIMDKETYQRRLKGAGDRPFENAFVCEVV